MEDPSAAPSWRQRVLDVVWPNRPSTWRGVRERLIPELINIGRLTLATVLGYALARVLLPGNVDLTGALTALLVVQASARGSFQAGFGRVLAVLSGVGLALLLSAWVGLTWWSLGLLIAASLVVAAVFRLRGAALEVPISAMLILGAAGHDVAAETRVYTTLIGAGVGMLLPFALPPAIPTQPATQAVRSAGERLGRVFEQAAEYTERQPISAAVAQEWFTDTRRSSESIGRARSRIRTMQEMRTWNTRAWGKADIAPILSTGLDALERCLLAARALFLVVANEAPRDATVAETPFTDEIRQAFAVVLADVGECIDAYAALLEADAGGDVEEAETQLRQAVDVLDETRAILTDLILVNPGESGSWMMHASVLKAVDQILAELNLETHVGYREAWKWTQLGLQLPGGTVGPEIRNPVHRWSQRRLLRRAVRSATTQADVQADFSDNQPTESLPVIPAPVVGRDEVRSGETPQDPGH